MTFEDFLDESQVGYSTIETRDDLEDVIKRTWNAAIEASLLAAASAPAAPMGMSVWEQVEGQIKKLLTG